MNNLCKFILNFYLNFMFFNNKKQGLNTMNFNIIYLTVLLKIMVIIKMVKEKAIFLFYKILEKKNIEKLLLQIIINYIQYFVYNLLI